jgi:multicomponent Na+:H+ antiporter subunit G
MILDLISTLLILIGTTFIVISAIGVVRMPDLYLRMSASTKSSTLGVGMIFWLLLFTLTSWAFLPGL